MTHETNATRASFEYGVWFDVGQHNDLHQNPFAPVTPWKKLSQEEKNPTLQGILDKAAAIIVKAEKNQDPNLDDLKKANEELHTVMGKLNPVANKAVALLKAHELDRRKLGPNQPHSDYVSSIMIQLDIQTREALPAFIFGDKKRTEAMKTLLGVTDNNQPEDPAHRKMNLDYKTDGLIANQILGQAQREAQAIIAQPQNYQGVYPPKSEPTPAGKSKNTGVGLAE